MNKVGYKYLALKDFNKSIELNLKSIKQYKNFDPTNSYLKIVNKYFNFAFINFN